MPKALRIVEIIVGAVELPVFVMTAYNLYRQEINPDAPLLIKILPNWHWGVWLSVFLSIFLIMIILEFYRRSSNSSESSYNKSPIARHDHIGDITYGDKVAGDKVDGNKLIDSIGTISNSFNTSNSNVPPEFYRPTRNDLKHRIGVDIQKFAEQFKAFKYRSKIGDKCAQYTNVSETFKPMYDDLLPHAKLILSDTSIPELIVDLQRQITLCWMRLSDISAEQEQRSGYITGHEPVPRDLLYRLDVSLKSLDEIIAKIDSLIDQLIELCKGSS